MKETRQQWLAFLGKPLFTMKLGGILLPLATLFLLSLFLYSFRSTWLTELSELLIEDHPIKKTEALLVMGGEITSTIDYVASIYSKVQPRLILVTPNGRKNQIVERLTQVHKLPMKKVRILPYTKVVTSTYEEAVALQNYCQQVPIKSVTIVATLFHTGRTYWTFRTLFPKEMEIRMTAAPEERYSKNDWWQKEAGLVSVNNEFLKWAYYWWKYR